MNKKELQELLHNFSCLKIESDQRMALENKTNLWLKGEIKSLKNRIFNLEIIERLKNAKKNADKLQKVPSKKKLSAADAVLEELKQDPLPHSYICGECAKNKGGVWGGFAATCHMAVCKYCNEKKSLACITDYDWPALKRSAIWD